MAKPEEAGNPYLLGASILGDSLAAYGTWKSTKSQVKQAQKQAELLNQSADELRQRTEINVQDIQRRGRESVADYTVMQGARGGQSGDVTGIRDMGAIYEGYAKQAQNMAREGEWEARAKNIEAQSMLDSAKGMKKAAKWQIAGSILGSGIKDYAIWSGK